MSVLQRRITELEQALDRCQKRLEIPTVALAAHPEVGVAGNKVGQGGKVDLDALGLGRRVQDDAFLNQVQVRRVSGSCVLLSVVIARVNVPSVHAHMCCCCVPGNLCLLVNNLS